MISCATSVNPLLVLNAAEAHIQVVLAQPRACSMPTRSSALASPSSTFLQPLLAHLPHTRCVPVSWAVLACVRGPGSFTGLRIAHATMHGLARPHAIPMAGLDYHTLLGSTYPGLPAFSTPSRMLDCHLCPQRPCLPSGFSADQPIDTVRFYSVPEACAMLLTRSQPKILAGSARRLHEEFQALPNTVIMPASFDTPAPSWLLNAAHQARFSTTASQLLYVGN